MNQINTMEDLFEMLDKYTEGVDWNAFYTKRDKPAPFLKYNKLPDKCVVDFIKEHDIKVSFDGAFALERVSSVIISDGTENMAANAFNSCGVKYVYLPASLTQFDGWSHSYDTKKLYYGSTKERWEALCTVERSKVDVEQNYV